MPRQEQLSQVRSLVRTVSDQTTQLHKCIATQNQKQKLTWKSKVVLVAACNSCPCGWYGSKNRRCVCTISQILAYRRRISGPILDRIDLHVYVEERTMGQSDFLLLLNKSKEFLLHNL